MAAGANPALAELVALAHGARPRYPPTTVVAVDGPAGSGKTTLAGQLGVALGEPADAAPGHGGTPAATVLHMDDLYPGWGGLADGPVNLARWILAPLAAGRPARYRRFDWERDTFAEWHDVPPVPALIVEGVGSGATLAAEYLDLLLWVQAPEDVRHARGIERDGEAFAPHWRRWADQEQQLFLREKTIDRADVILDGTAPVC